MTATDYLPPVHIIVIGVAFFAVLLGAGLPILRTWIRDRKARRAAAAQVALEADFWEYTQRVFDGAWTD